jgi:hypothetical protein
MGGTAYRFEDSNNIADATIDLIAGVTMNQSCDDLRLVDFVSASLLSALLRVATAKTALTVVVHNLHFTAKSLKYVRESGGKS